MYTCYMYVDDAIHAVHVDDTKAEDDVEERVYHVTIPGTFVTVQSAITCTVHKMYVHMYMYIYIYIHVHVYLLPSNITQL